MRKQRVLALFTAFVISLTMLFPFGVFSNAEVTFTKPIATSSITPSNLDRNHFQGALLIDMQGDSLLYATGSADEKMPACSGIVTMMALYLSAVNLSSDTVITCGEDVEKYDGIGLKEGVQLAVCDLIAAVLYEGAEDALSALTSYLEETFTTAGKELLTVMNETASVLSMKSTYYSNTEGKYDPMACTSMRDVAILSEALYSQPMVKEALVNEEKSISSTDGDFKKTLKTSTAVELSKTTVFLFGSGSADEGGAVSLVAVRDSRPLLLVLSLNSKTIRYSKNAETLFDFGYDEFVNVDFVEMAKELAKSAVATVDQIEVTGFEMVETEGVSMYESVSKALSGSILENASAFSVVSSAPVVDGETVTANLSLRYLNTNEIASFEATAQAPEELKVLYATPTPMSTSTGYENTVHHTPSAVTPQPAASEEAENPYTWIIYIGVVLFAGIAVIAVAERIKKNMMMK